MLNKLFTIIAVVVVLSISTFAQTGTIFSQTQGQQPAAAQGQTQGAQSNTIAGKVQAGQISSTTTQGSTTAPGSTTIVRQYRTIIRTDKATKDAVAAQGQQIGALRTDLSTETNQRVAGERALQQGITNVDNRVTTVDNRVTQVQKRADDAYDRSGWGIPAFVLAAIALFVGLIVGLLAIAMHHWGPRNRRGNAPNANAQNACPTNPVCGHGPRCGCGGYGRPVYYDRSVRDSFNRVVIAPQSTSRREPNSGVRQVQPTDESRQAPETLNQVASRITRGFQSESADEILFYVKGYKTSASIG